MTMANTRLVVTQNGAVKLYHNVGAKPGCVDDRAGGNPPVSAQAYVLVRPTRRPGQRNPRRGGYWSQDSAVQVLSTPEVPTRLWVRWPGGKTNMADVPAGAREVSLDSSGKLKALR
jgi:hypothetical protein